MDWITDTIAIGNYAEAEDAALLRQASIGSILSLIPGLVPGDAARLGVQRIEVVRLVDGPGNDIRLFKLAIDLLMELVAQSPPVLVHCRAGRGRSAVVVAGYLMKSLGIDAEDALARVAAKRETYVLPEMARLLDWLD